VILMDATFSARGSLQHEELPPRQCLEAEVEQRNRAGLGGCTRPKF
jgi:hypothetical protein